MSEFPNFHRQLTGKVYHVRTTFFLQVVNGENNVFDIVEFSVLLSMQVFRELVLQRY